LATLSAATDRPKTWHIEQAIRRYLDAELQFLEAVEEGLRDLEAGDVVDHAVVVEDVRRRRERRAAGAP
jgi:predicted transcriptional regulator